MIYKLATNLLCCLISVVSFTQESGSLDINPLKFKSNYVQIAYWNENYHFHSQSLSKFKPPQQDFKISGMQFLAGKSFFLNKNKKARVFIHAEWIRLGVVLFGSSGVFISPLHPGLGLYLRPKPNFSISPMVTFGYHMFFQDSFIYQSWLFSPILRVNIGNFSLFSEFRKRKLKLVGRKGTYHSISLGIGFHF
jgi:hypothetical protein